MSKWVQLILEIAAFFAGITLVQLLIEKKIEWSFVIIATIIFTVISVIVVLVRKKNQK
jgi:uncharacterized membrane protein YoaK (UPF0700 family)